MSYTAQIVGSTKNQVFVRVPEKFPNKILTLERKRFPKAEKGDEVSVTVKGDLKFGPNGVGWWADVKKAKN